MQDILVVGSANIDTIIPVASLPTPGETVSGRDPVTRFGGKGANQAVAAARCGGVVRFLGALGGDGGGEAYLARFAGEGIDTSGIARVDGAATGSAIIFVEDSAQNMIVVSHGANALCTPRRLPSLAGALRRCDIVLLQLEIPLPTVLHVIREARHLGRRVVLNPSPIPAGFTLDSLECDYLIVNTVELAALSRLPAGGEEDVMAAAASLRGKGISNVIVTRGGGSTLLVTKGGTAPISTHPVTPVDTVGAGDTFAGAFCAALAEGQSDVEAVRFANVAAALSTLKLGAQESMPPRDKVRAAREQR